MSKEQKDLIYILEEIGNEETNVDAKKAVEIIKPVEMLEKRYQNLDKGEREKLMEGCQLMYEDCANGANLCLAAGALIISALALFISVVSLTVGAAETMSEIVKAVAITANIFICFAAVASIHTLVRVQKRAKIADKYRNVLLALISLLDSNKGGKENDMQ